MLCVLFGAGPTIKSVRPPTRDYTRIERRFYMRIVKEMLVKLEEHEGAGPDVIRLRTLVDFMVGKE